MAGSIRDLDDDQLLKGADRLLRDDRARTAELLRHIDEIDRRDLSARHGYSSLFAFCLGRWNMSEHEAYNRIGAARAGARFPVIFDMVGRGELHLTGVNRLRPHLTQDNHREVLAEARHKTITEIEKMVAGLSPQPDKPSRIRRVPQPAATLADVAPPDARRSIRLWRSGLSRLRPNLHGCQAPQARRRP